MSILIFRPGKASVLSSGVVKLSRTLQLVSRTVLAYAVLMLGSVPAVLAAEPGWLGPTSLLADRAGAKLYVSEPAAGQVAVLRLPSGALEESVQVPGRPMGLCMSADGQRLYVTSALPRGTVTIIELSEHRSVGSVKVGHTPVAGVISPDGTHLYVCNRFDNSVSVVDLREGKTSATMGAGREPIGMVLAADGEKLFVANHLPAGPADRGDVAATVTVIDTVLRKVEETIRLPDGSTGVRGICASPDGKYAYMTHILARYQLPTTQLTRGWMNANAMTVIDLERGARVNTVLLDDLDLGAANPWGVVCSADGRRVCVSHAGTHEVSLVDRAALHERLASVAERGAAAAGVPNDLTFLAGIRRRVKLPGNGLRGVATVGDTLYVAEFFSDAIGVVDVQPGTGNPSRSISLGPQFEIDITRRGEMLFNDASLCFQQWQSCASCHPDGRADGLNWDLLNDGVGNPRNTKSMVWSHRTPPAMITGIRDKAEAAVRAGIRHIQLVIRPESDAEAIDAYLRTLEPVTSPHRDDGKLSVAAERGEKIFAQTGCVTCHPAPLYTDLKMHDVGTGLGRDAERHFDTPTLVEMWRTSPYLYDGRSAIMREVLTTHNPDDRHGRCKGLGEDDLADLIEFILSL